MNVERLDEMVYIEREKRNGILEKKMIEWLGGIKCKLDMMGCRKRNIEKVKLIDGKKLIIGKERERREEEEGKREWERMVEDWYWMEKKVIRRRKWWNKMCEEDFRGGK